MDTQFKPTLLFLLLHVVLLLAGSALAVIWLFCCSKTCSDIFLMDFLTLQNFYLVL